MLKKKKIVQKFIKLLVKFGENCGSLENFLKPKHLAYKSASMGEHFHVRRFVKETNCGPCSIFLGHSSTHRSESEKKIKKLFVN